MAASLARPPVRPRALARARVWVGHTPVAGSIEKLWIFSGVAWATSSMSMPPSVEATTETIEVSRSTSSDR
ncbi:hypothetical protein D3C87_1793270 [compost metagenome]